jgi:hypothetical protein
MFVWNFDNLIEQTKIIYKDTLNDELKKNGTKKK